MSIINEALRKAQRLHTAHSSHASISTIPLKTELKETLLKKKSHFNWGPAFILGVLLLIVGPILAPLFSAPFKVSVSPTHTDAPHMLSVGSVLPAPPAGAPTYNPTVRPQFAIEEAPRFPEMFKALPTRHDFSLSGIVFSKKESYCLINGKVLKVGETISGAAVVNITPDQVTLDVEGQLTTLSNAG